MKVLTAQNTAFELDELKPDLAFLPIGATEQHSRHLPLATDTIEGDILSIEILTALDVPGYAYLLPSLAMSSSEENMGYRGTINLTPKTMRAIVRDTYQSLSSVGINQLVLCPWHGGNFILKPVTRELNQELGGGKVFYVNPWEHVPQEIYNQFSKGFEVHSGDVETSLMLAIAPGLVKEERKDNPFPGGFNPAYQDMWSMKTLSEGEGHAGHPSEATAEKGEMLRGALVKHVATYMKNLLGMAKKYDTY